MLRPQRTRNLRVITAKPVNAGGGTVEWPRGKSARLHRRCGSGAPLVLRRSYIPQRWLLYCFTAPAIIYILCQISDYTTRMRVWVIMLNVRQGARTGRVHPSATAHCRDVSQAPRQRSRAQHLV